MTNSFIEKKVQLLEDITCHEDFCFQKRRKQNFETDYCECSLKDAKSFLRSALTEQERLFRLPLLSVYNDGTLDINATIQTALRDHTAYLKEKVEGMKRKHGILYDGVTEENQELAGAIYNQAMDDILALLDKEIWERTTTH